MDQEKTSRTASEKNGKALVIVESPAKAKTINKYLGKNYVVKASMGHVRDLPQKAFGVDLEKDFDPTYRVLPTRKKVVTDLKKEAGKADRVFLATDLDREGEAIAWHLVKALGLQESRTQRVIFNEITKPAIQRAFEHPHDIDMDKVNAQQARRILDRIVGYQLSPLLWKKIAKGLSAGRVQSVAVKLIVEREREIEKFVPEEYWKVAALLHAGQAPEAAMEAFETHRQEYEEKPDSKGLKRLFEKHQLFRAELIEVEGQKFKSDNKEQTDQLLEWLGVADYRIADLASKTRLERPPAPFTTASLQQQAASRLKYTTSRTMRVAQQLYEGVELGPDGSIALITYMRTDSTHLAGEALTAVRGYIQTTFGAEYLPEKPNFYASRASAQEAHEAIRPTDVNRRPEDVRSFLTSDQYRLYELIWKRFVACQMPPAQWLVTDAIVHAAAGERTGVFKAIGRTLAFPGFLSLLPYRLEDADAELPRLEKAQPLHKMDVRGTQHFTQPPPRFNEASLVRMLEQLGIGRPSTYAAIISTIQDRGYVVKDDAKFLPTDLGKVVTDQLMQHFPRIMDVKFTSHMEEQLDKIEEAHLDWVKVLNEFYQPFNESLDQAREQMEKQAAESPYTCETCGKPMVYRWTKTGRFLACSGYPECTNAMSVDEEGKPVKNEVRMTEHACPKCGKPMAFRQSKYGPFLGCSGYPECKTTVPCDKEGNPLRKVKPEEVNKTCGECGKPMVAKKGRGRRGGFLACTGYPACKETEPIPDDIAIDWPEPQESGVTCPNCGKPMLVRRSRRGPFLGCKGFPKCRKTMPMPKEGEAAKDDVKKEQEGQGEET